MIQTLKLDAAGSLSTGGMDLARAPLAEGELLWVDLEAEHEVAESFLRELEFHPLAIEDTFTLQHQPRVEEYANHLFVIVRGIDFNAKDPLAELHTLKLAAFLSGPRLVTVHRAASRSINTIRRRILESRRMPTSGLVQVLATVCDEMIDHYFPVLDEIGGEIEELEASVLAQPSQEHLERILDLRRKLSEVRRAMLPHRAVFGHLAGSRSPIFDASTTLSFRDTLENVMRLADAVDQQRDQLGNVKDTYLSVVSQRTNDIMKVLTLFSAVMLPLTFIAGVYGMNFEHMPELATRYGYFVVLGVMAAVGTGMVLWFKRRRWL